MKKYFAFLSPLALLAFALGCATAQPPAQQQQQQQARDANGMTPLATASKTIAQPLIDVGLLSDQDSAKFERVDGGYLIVSGKGPSILRRGFTASAPLAGAAVHYAVQVAALSDRSSAEALVAQLKSQTQQTVIMPFDAQSGTYKVMVGDFADRAGADALRQQLQTSGFGGGKDAMVVRRPSDQAFDKTIRIVDDEGNSYSISGQSLLVLPATAETIAIGGQPYRGGARLFVNARGLLNVINELNLEDYTRGVVPNEMGPKTYDELEALKAQALAARTYAVKRLGEYQPEGYDICATPACQVYKGFSTEDPVTDQAVRETANMIITYQGQPIDALFTSTCGGATSDVGVMFPGRTDPYLKSVSCIELELATVAGRDQSGMLNDTQLDARLFQALSGAAAGGSSYSAKDVVASVGAAAKVAGVNIASSVAEPASARRGDVLRYLGSALDFTRFADRLMFAEDRGYFFPNSPKDDPAYRVAAFMIKYRILPSQNVDAVDLNAAMPREELHALLYSWLTLMKSFTEVNGRIEALAGRKVSVKVATGKITDYTLPTGIPVFRKINDRAEEYRNVPVMIGDKTTLVLSAKSVPVAFIVQGNYDGAAFDRTSSFSSWVRSYRADELVPAISRRNAIKTLIDLRPLHYDNAGRVVDLEVTAEGGRKFTLAGLPIRWSLDIPDNLFEMTKSVDADGVDRYTFYGKGWGHGVGMCQAGAFGMAMRGRNATEIIKHYYTGVDITPFAGR